MGFITDGIRTIQKSRKLICTEQENGESPLGVSANGMFRVTFLGKIPNYEINVYKVSILILNELSSLNNLWKNGSLTLNLQSLR